MGVAEDFAPSFTQKPQLRQEDEGNKLVFECKLLACPKPDIVWFRSDVKLIEDQRTTYKLQSVGTNTFVAILEIDDVVETDAGLYKVVAKNKMGDVAASINLNFSPADEPHEKQIDGLAPTFSKKPSIRQEDEGKRLLFECRIQADPKPTISWFHNGAPVASSSRHKLLVDKDGHSYFATLQIQNVTVEDAGKYKVTAKDELGESNATISLNFDSGDDAGGFAPSFIEKPRIIPNEEGTLIILRCKCTASPKPVVTWFKGNKSISESSKIKMKVIEKENTYELVLEISDPVGPDSGTYRCHVKNDHGESNANLNLNIEAEPEQEGDPPTFVEKPRIRSENNGKLVVMDCVVKANPKPEVVWYHNGVTISQSTKLSWKVEEKGDHYHIRLELRNPRKDDQGLYKCNIKNGNGELNANLTLNIEIIPVIKQAPKVVTINKKKSAVIECRVQSVFEPQVIWMKENTVVREIHNKKTRIERITDGEYIVKLEMEPCSQADKGNYKLTVKNEKGEATSTLIEVTEIPEDDAPKAPTISQKLKAQTVNEGSTINLESSLSVLDKTVKVSWYKNSSEITESSSTKTSFDGKCAKLIISSAKSTNSGTYKVKFSNKAGSSESSAEIVVKEKRKLEEEEEKEEKKVKQKKSEKKEVKEETDISISEKDEESIMDWEDDEEDTLMDVDEISFSKDDKKRKSESEEETVKTKKASIKKEEKASVTEKRRSSLLKKEEKYVSSDEESVTEKSRRSSILKKNEQTSVTEKRRSSLLKKEEKIFSSQEEKVTESRRSSIVKKEEAVNNIDEKKSKVTSKTSKKSEAEVVENSVTPKKRSRKSFYSRFIGKRKSY